MDKEKKRLGCMEITRFALGTIAATFLTGAAIYVSWLSYGISKSQLEIARIQMAPDIHVVFDRIYDDIEQAYTTDIIQVFLVDGKIFGNPDPRDIVFFKVALQDDKMDIEKQLVPVSSYYSSVFPVDNRAGILYDIRGYNNYQKFLSVKAEFGELAASQGFVDAQLDLIRYFRLTYKDSLEAVHLEHYEYSLGRSIQTLDPKIAGLVEKHIKADEEGKCISFNGEYDEIAKSIMKYMETES